MSTDCCNSQNVFNIRKRKYLTMFDKIQNKKVDVEEKTNKSCHLEYQVNRFFLIGIHSMQG